jgi:Zn-dependent alcohol dehydrogenase
VSAGGDGGGLAARANVAPATRAVAIIVQSRESMIHMALERAGVRTVPRRRRFAKVAEERTLKGCYVGSSAPQRDVPRMISLFRAGRLPVDQLLTHRLRLEEINEGFDRLREGIGVRQVIVFE